MSGPEGSNPYVAPQVRAILKRMQESMAERGPIGSAPPELMRRRFNEDVSAWNQELPELQTTDLLCPCRPGGVATRLYDPDPQAGLLPALIFIHGGGWVAGDLDTNERTLRLLALRSGARILSIDYPLSPEHRFPVALDWCVSVSRWLRQQGADWGLDPERLGIGGDSAGGNLALATALDLQGAGEAWLQYMLLVYPALSPHADTPSHARFGGGDFGLGSEGMAFFWSSYLGEHENRSDPRAAPLLADKAGLPPACLITAGLDPLTDDSTRLAEQLQQAGVPVTRKHYEGVIHGFFSMALMLDAGDRAVADAAEYMRAAVR